MLELSDKFRNLLATYSLDGWQKLDIKFEGGGDSGYIEEITLFNPDLGEHGDWINVKKSQENDLIEDYFYKFIAKNLDDWHNDGGGYGLVVFDIPTGTYNLEVHYRAIRTEYDEGSISDF